MKAWTNFITAAALVGALVVACPAVRAADMPSEEAIRSAKTAADHEGLAAAFESEAKSPREQAKRHREMRASYDKPPGYLKHKLGFDQHCTAIVASLERAANEADSLAKIHRQMAAKAK